MNEEQYTPEQAIMIPAFVHFNTVVSDSAKLLYGLIAGLSFKLGYCYATNGYFASLYKKSESTVSRWVSELVEQNFIKTEMVKIANGTERRITPQSEPLKTPQPVSKNANTPIRKNANTPIRRNEDTPIRKNKKTPIRKNENHIHIVGYNEVDNTLEETTDVVSSLENNSDELFSPAKNGGHAQKKQEAPTKATASATTADKKEKSCAKKEKAPIQRTAITAEFERRALPLFATAKNQPTDEWYAETISKYGAENVWAIFRAMHDHCESTGVGYTAPANGFKSWAISADAYEVFKALRGYWRDTYGGEQWKELGELTKGEKAALNSLALKFKARIASKNLITTLANNARQFFDNLPEKWATPRWFNLTKIDEEMTSIYAAMQEGQGQTTKRPHSENTRMSADEKRMQFLNNWKNNNMREDFELALREMFAQGKHDLASYRLAPELYSIIAAECGVSIPQNFA